MMIEFEALSKMTVAEMLRHFMDKPADQLAISDYLRLKEAMETARLIEMKDFNKVQLFVEFLLKAVDDFAGGNAQLEAIFLNGLLGRKTHFLNTVSAHGDDIRPALSGLTDVQFERFLELIPYLVLHRYVHSLVDIIDLEQFGHERVVKLMFEAIRVLCHRIPTKEQETHGVAIGEALKAVLETFLHRGLKPSQLTGAYDAIFKQDAYRVNLLVEAYNLPILSLLLSHQVPMDEDWLVKITYLRPRISSDLDRVDFITLLKQHDLYYRYEACLVEMVYARSLEAAKLLEPGHRNAHHVSRLSEGLELAPLHILLLNNCIADFLFERNSMDLSVGLGMVTRRVDDDRYGDLVYGENVLHLAIRMKLFGTASRLLVLAQEQGINLIDGKNSLGQTPLQCLALLASNEQDAADLMQQMIACGPDLAVEDNSGMSLVSTFCQYAPDYLRQLLYDGHMAYAYVAKRLRLEILKVVPMDNKGLVDAIDQEFVEALRLRMITVSSELCIEQAHEIYSHCESYFEQLGDKQTFLSQQIFEHMQAMTDPELKAVFSLRNVTTLSHELAFADKEALWSPSYFRVWCAAWKYHSPHVKVSPLEKLGVGLMREVTRSFSLLDMARFQRVSKQAYDVANQCLYTPALLDEINDRFPEGEVKRRFKAMQETLAEQGRNTPKDQILALVLDPDLQLSWDKYQHFLAIVMNRAFSTTLPPYQPTIFNSPVTAPIVMVQDLFFIAAAMRRTHHFMAMLQVSNGFEFSSNRVTQVLAATGQLSLLRALANVATEIEHTPIHNNAITPFQDRVNWNGVRDDLVVTGAPRTYHGEYDNDLLPGEHVGLLHDVGQYRWWISRFAAQSPLMASLNNAQRDVALFLASLDVVHATYEEIKLAKRLGYHQVCERLISNVPSDSPLRVQLLASNIIRGKLNQEDTHQLIIRLLPKLKAALCSSASYNKRPSNFKQRLLSRWQETDKQDNIKRELLLLRNEFLTDEDALALCERLHELMHDEQLDNKDVRGSDLMRLIIDEIHKDPELCVGINLRQLEGGAAIHDEIFNNHLPTIELNMPPSYAPKSGEKPSIAYRNFYRAYLRATLTFWKHQLTKMADETDREENGSFTSELPKKRGKLQTTC